MEQLERVAAEHGVVLEEHGEQLLQQGGDLRALQDRVTQLQHGACAHGCDGAARRGVVVVVVVVVV